MIKVGWIIIVFGIGFLIIYFHLYLNTDFRHILISTNKISSNSQDQGPKLGWEDLLSGPLNQNQSDLLTYVRHHIIHPPSSLPYNLTSTNDPSVGQAQLVLRALNHKRNGFFVECGAWDGETRSNTLILERNYSWQGLLVEANPFSFEKLKLKRRKAWSTNVCLAVKPYPHKVYFGNWEGQGRIVTSKWALNSSEVQCFPLYTLLAGLNVTTVDYLSLDIEGSEFKVLRTIPHQFLTNIRLISVEFSHQSNTGKSALHKWMSLMGFTRFGQVTHPNNLANDWIFINRNVENSMLMQRFQNVNQLVQEERVND